MRLFVNQLHRRRTCALRHQRRFLPTNGGFLLGEGLFGLLGLSRFV
jgi:hypothetical protein